VKLILLVTTTLGGTIGWWIGAPIGIFTAFVGSMIGTGVGIWGGKVLARRWGID
jgi:phosphate/sulfate permease